MSSLVKLCLVFFIALITHVVVITKIIRDITDFFLITQIEFKISCHVVLLCVTKAVRSLIFQSKN
jgi:hypothetical protein